MRFCPLVEYLPLSPVQLHDMYAIVLAQLVDQEPNTIKDLESIFERLLGAAIPAAGLVLFVMLILAGLNWMAAGDNPKNVEMARNRATYAIYGIILIALAFLIIRFISLFTGVTGILDFTVTQ